ncbi:MAG TPA: hypothetical protein VFV19_02190 [Candidatus Polarisedimenticolaceae bacterium]|nr:hypothetical protein [Candidatus Polarisedimenticolaceae bacterium]
MTPATLMLAALIHLQGGGTVEADRWWIDGDTLFVESATGTVGMPRALLVSVDESAAAPKGKASQPPAKKPPAAHPDPEAIAAMKAGNEALMARDYETAVLKFHDVIEREPDAAGARVGLAVAEMKLGRDNMALPVVLDGLVRDPASAELQEVLGDLRDRDERVDEALTAWREAFRLAPSDRVREKIVKGEREMAAAKNYAFSAAAHFNMRYDGDLDQDLVASITDFLEERYVDFSSTYHHAPSQPITVLLYPKQAFHDVTQAGSEVIGLYDGKIRVPLAGLKKLDPAAEKVLAHELTHAFVHSKTRGNCPKWLHEGLAQIAEPRELRRSQRADLAAKVRPDDPKTWPNVAFSYPAALSLTSYIADQRGLDVLVAVLDRLGAGDSLDEALHAYYGATYAEMAKAWAESVRAGTP